MMRKGTDPWKSTSIMMKSSTRPRKDAATNPRSVPRKEAIRVPTRASEILMRIE